MTESLKNKTIKGVFWSGIDRFASQGISFIITVILARILTPEDYGLVAMLGIFISIAQAFIDSGFSSAVVRKKNRTQVDLSTAFYTNIVLGIVCYIVLFLFSNYIAQFYSEPILEDLIKVIGLVFFLFSFNNIQQAILAINIDFKLQTLISLVSVVFSGIIGIILAYCGWGVWALAYQQVSAALCRTILLWLLVKWRPSLSFSKESFRELFSFGSKVLATAVLNSIFNNIYTIIVGKRYQSATLGFYSRADQLASLPSTNIANIIKRVTFPVLSTIQDEEKRFINSYLKILSLTAYIVYPMMALLAALSSPIIILLLTDKWADTIPLLQILSFALMFGSTYFLNLNIMEVKGRSDYLLKSETISKILGVLLLIVTLPFGIEMICWGRLLSSILNVVVSLFFVKKVINISVWRVLKILLAIIGSSLFMYVIVSILLPLIELYIIQLAVGCIVGGLVYLFFSEIFHCNQIADIKQILLKR